MNNKALIIGFAVMVIGFLSCKKGGDLVTIPTAAALNVINASGDTLNLYQNGTRVNNLTSLAPFSQYGYLSVVSGAQMYQLKKAGSTDILADAALTLKTDNRYTLFTAGADKVFLLKDSLAGSDLAQVRFVNASPTTGALDVVIRDSIKIKNIAFKSATPFYKISGGKSKLVVTRAGTTDTLLSGQITLVAASGYTIFSKGVIGGTGSSKFGVPTLISR